MLGVRVCATDPSDAVQNRSIDPVQVARQCQMFVEKDMKNTVIASVSFRLAVQKEILGA